MVQGFNNLGALTRWWLHNLRHVLIKACRFFRFWLQCLKKVQIWPLKQNVLNKSKKVPKNAEFHNDFKPVEKVLKKFTNKKVVAKMWQNYARQIGKFHRFAVTLLFPVFWDLSSDMFCSVLLQSYYETYSHHHKKSLHFSRKKNFIGKILLRDTKVTSQNLGAIFQQLQVNKYLIESKYDKNKIAQSKWVFADKDIFWLFSEIQI